MGGCQCREARDGLDLSYSDTGTYTCTQDSEGEREEDESPSPAIAASTRRGITPSETLNPAPNINKAVKLFLHIGGSSLSARWIISEKFAPCIFFKPFSFPNNYSDIDNEEQNHEYYSLLPWFLRIGSKVRVRVGPEMQMKAFPDQGRVDFIADGVWAVKFSSPETYNNFQNDYHRCSFENAYGFEANEENKVKVFGKDFMNWAQPDSEDDSIWEDASKSFEKSPAIDVPREKGLCIKYSGNGSKKK